MAKATSKLFEEEKTSPMKEDAINLPEAEEPVVEEPKKDEIQDIDLSIIKRQRFRINGDNSKILELNVSDLNIAVRLNKAYPRLNKLMDKVADKYSNLPDNTEDMDDESFTKISEALEMLDTEMRKELDYIFDAPVSEVCSDGGNMWDPIEGAFRYEHIIDKLSRLYENNLNNEFSKIRRKIDNKTGKYTKVKATKKR